MNVLQSLTAVALLVLGMGRTIIFLLPSLIMKKPVRLDLPIPGFKVDIVFVFDDTSAKVLTPIRAVYIRIAETVSHSLQQTALALHALTLPIRTAAC